MSKVLKDKIEYALKKECTKQEYEILLFLKTNLKSIDDLTAKSVGEKCYCSTSAVNRAVKRMNFDGFSEFKNFERFSSTIEKQQTAPQEHFSNYVNMILDRIDYNQVKKVADQIKSLDIMYVYGNGVSNISSLFLFRQLFNLDYNVVYVPDLDLLTKITHGTIICVSNVGTNEHVNDILVASKVNVLSITKHNSPLDRLSIESITHNIDYMNATELEREQQIQMLLLIGALIDNLN